MQFQKKYIPIDRAIYLSSYNYFFNLDFNIFSPNIINQLRIEIFAFLSKPINYLVNDLIFKNVIER